MAKVGGGSGRGGGGGVVTGRSKSEIDRWSSIMRNQGDAGRMRLTRYLGSLILGRGFGESVEDYFSREGLTQFSTWAHGALGR